MVWNDDTVNRLQLLLALAGLALFGWGYVLAHRGRSSAYQKLRDGLLLSLGVDGALAWFNLCLGHLSLIFLALRGSGTEPWFAAALGSTFIGCRSPRCRSGTTSSTWQ